jgi:hypothetical protein
VSAKMHTVTGERLTAHPLASLFPMASEDELAELKADIKKHGQLEPIRLFEGQILDGRNRDRVCLELGIEPKTVEYEGDDPAAFVISMNLHRRHLSQAQKAEVIEKLLAAQPEWSDRTIGKIARVDHKTVGAKRAELEDVGSIPHVERRADSKGRSFPTSKGRKAGSPSPARPAIAPAAPREAPAANAVMEFARLLHEGEIGRYLKELLRLLGDEKERIAELPEAERASLAGEFLGLLHISADDLRPVVSVPLMEGGLAAANGEKSLPALVQDDLGRVLEIAGDPDQAESLPPEPQPEHVH